MMIQGQQQVYCECAKCPCCGKIVRPQLGSYQINLAGNQPIPGLYQSTQNQQSCYSQQPQAPQRDKE